jgi:hypothetical protein
MQQASLLKIDTTLPRTNAFLSWEEQRISQSERRLCLNVPRRHDTQREEKRRRRKHAGANKPPMHSCHCTHLDKTLSAKGSVLFCFAAVAVAVAVISPCLFSPTH